MPQKKVQPGVAYTKSGEKKISGSASTTPKPRNTVTPAGPTASMVNSIKSRFRARFDDQSNVDSLYRWK